MPINHLLKAGGVIILPLLICLVMVTVMVIERSRFWLGVSRQQERFAKQVMELYRHQSDLTLVKVKQHLDLPLARIFLAALELESPTAEEFRLALESELQAELPILKRFSNIFDLIVGLSPLLGLIGTVIGLITSFGGLNIGDIGGTKTATVSAGISEALITTAAGLLVATVALIFATTFTIAVSTTIGPNSGVWWTVGTNLSSSLRGQWWKGCTREG